MICDIEQYVSARETATSRKIDLRRNVTKSLIHHISIHIASVSAGEIYSGLFPRRDNQRATIIIRRPA
nr:MAG TPA: hypothetical protein [Caudoviricetes sp.]